MNIKKPNLILSFCLVLGASAGLNCAAADDSSVVVAVLTSKTGHVPASEPTVRRAIEVLMKHQSTQPEGKRIRTDMNNPISNEHPLRSPSLIIGDPGMVPM
ncbi:MAG: hypothetical protein K2W95_12390 [Candidatus Obscuribacterales bacterium]|nr:hypothetical protein [Candidatus Obscuribacterales bacterium]